MRVNNPDSPIYYVYEHFSVIDGKVFYVGIGKNDRVFAQGEHRNKFWKKKVYSDGGFRFRILYNKLTRKEALVIEKQIILKYGIDNLCNIVSDEGNSTAFKKGFTPWNKGLTGAQACSYKPIIYNNKKFESVDSLIKYLGIGKTTYYRRVRRGDISILLYNSN